MANVLFFLSGVSSLIYQICWIRWSSQIFGSSITAISAVTAVFFGAMALGNCLIVKKERKFDAKLYAKLEFLVGIFGALSVALFTLLNKIYIPGNILTVFVHIVSIGVSAIFIGMNFPVMVGLAKENSTEKQISGVYAVNSLGAVCGAILTGFLLLQNIGIRNSIFTASGINILVAVSALFLFKKSAKNIVSNEKIPFLPIFLFAFVGFNGMLAELIASRFLALIITNTIFVYTLTISCVIFGLALGAGIFGAISDKISQKLNWFGIISIVWSTVFSTVFLLNPAGFWMNIAKNQSILSILLITVLISFLPSLFSGMMLPATVQIVKKSAEKTAGILSAANTVGSIFGAIMCGFLFLPIFGIANTIILAFVVSILVGSVAILKYSQKKIAIVIILLPLAALFLGRENYADFIKNYLSFDKKQTVVNFKEGREAIVSITSKNGIKTMEIDRLWQGENRKTRQIMAAHIPSIISKNDPKNILLIGFGTGLTASRFLYYGIDGLFCVDIEESVFDFAKSEFDVGFLSNPKVRIIVEDGRKTIRRNDRKYDIISIEIGQIFRPYCSGFYTVDFYENAKKSLNQDGIITQFVPIASFDFAVFKSIIKTFVSVFPNSQLWFNGSEFLLVGTNGEFGNLSGKRAQEIFSQNEKVVEDLRWSYWGGSLYMLSDRRILAASFLCDRNDLARMSQDGEIFTDNVPKLEYYSALHRQNQPFVDDIKTYLSPIGATMIPEISQQKDIDGINAIRNINLGDIISSELYFAYTNQKQSAPGLLEEALKYNSLNLPALMEIANIYYEKKEYLKSAECFNRALNLDSQNSYLHRQYALVLIKLEEQNLAIDHLLTSIDINSSDYISHTILAGLMLGKNLYDLAAKHVAYALKFNPNYAEALKMQQYLQNYYSAGEN
ncbi:MAG: fused MFS/spermidine synthase [Chitinispirillales bacterium]|jgi:spermidine synthase|nr:fused MFS/spermidine synthase [Chitinispirillales bacterium]